MANTFSRWIESVVCLINTICSYVVFSFHSAERKEIEPPSISGKDWRLILLLDWLELVWDAQRQSTQRKHHKLYCEYLRVLPKPSGTQARILFSLWSIWMSVFGILPKLQRTKYFYMCEVSSCFSITKGLTWYKLYLNCILNYNAQIDRHKNTQRKMWCSVSKCPPPP